VVRSYVLCCNTETKEGKFNGQDIVSGLIAIVGFHKIMLRRIVEVDYNIVR
jgi:hypothetical protein